MFRCFSLQTQASLPILLLLFMLLTNCSAPKPPPPPSTNRVATAYYDKTEQVEQYLNQKGLSLQEGIQLFLRAFKLEKKLEVWAKHPQEETYQLIVTYPFCKSSGTIGPKRKEGDLQIPEGFYHIHVFNPKSQFYLSLGINYPNTADLKWADAEAPGSHIYIHGDCQTVGCIPITDDKIKELYILATEAKKRGQSQIPVHIFPTHLTSQNLVTISSQFPEHQFFWLNIEEGYTWFEKRKTLPKVKIDAVEGKYYFLEK